MTDTPFITLDDFDRAMKHTGASGHIAVAVSGGADSLALTLLLKDWGDRHGAKITALTVDHGLRAEATREAERVHEMLTPRGISHYTLTLEAPITGDTRIQETARQRRYDTLCDYCDRHGIKTLAVAHHLEDQFETVMMRLSRGSGVTGLSGMSNVRQRSDIRIIRPLLSATKDQLKDVCRNHDALWIEDPTNRDTTHTRILFRQSRDMLAHLGLTPQAVENSRRKISEAADFITHAKHMAEQQCLAETARGIAIDRAAYTALHPYIQKEILKDILITIGGSAYPPRQDALERLHHAMMARDFTGATLNRCQVSVTQNDTLTVMPENTADK